MTQGIQKQIGILPTIEAECHFVQVGREMLCGDAMPRSDDSALEQRESILDCIRMDVAVNVDLGFVLNRLVPIRQGKTLHRRRIGIEFIGHDYVHIRADILADKLRQHAGLGIFGMKEAQIAAALTDADNDLFGALAETGFALMAALDSANVSFVYFDGSVQHGLIYFLHGRTDAMAEVPRGLVADSQSPFDLISGHSLACLAEQEGREKPLLKWQVGIIKNRAGGHTELIVAFFAVEELLSRSEFRYRATASQAFRTIRPAQAHQQFSASFVGVKKVYNVN
jgi:hypothetical protein